MTQRKPDVTDGPDYTPGLRTLPRFRLGGQRGAGTALPTRIQEKGDNKEAIDGIREVVP